MTNRFNPDIEEAIRKNELVIFVGAGLSINYGFPNWTNLVKEILEELQKYESAYSTYIPLLKDPYFNVLTILDLIKKRNDENKVRDFLENRFVIEDNTPEEKFLVHKLLLQVSKKIITTNYDSLIEHAAEKSIKKVFSYSNQHRVSKLNTYEEYIFKLHGNYEEAADCILFLEDYEKLYSEEHPAINELKNIISNQTIIFIGFSLNDPYVASIFSHIKKLYSGLKPSHYILTTGDEDFSEYGVKKIKLNSYDETKDYLSELVEVKKKTVFNDEEKISSYSEKVERDIGIIHELFDRIILNRKNEVKSRTKNTDSIELDNKIKINFQKEEVEFVNDMSKTSFRTFALIDIVISQISTYEQDDIHADIKRRYILMKLENIPNIKILLNLIDHYTPDGKKDNPQYAAIAQAIVLYFFEDCTWGKKTEKELIEKL